MRRVSHTLDEEGSKDESNAWENIISWTSWRFCHECNDADGFSAFRLFGFSVLDGMVEGSCLNLHHKAKSSSRFGRRLNLFLWL